MGFEYLTNVPLDKAKEEYLQMLMENGFAARIERISVYEACGRITAAAVYAKICAPHYAASAMDGIAVNARDTFGATETTPVVLNVHQFSVVDTGDPIPEYCDAVIMIEELVNNEDGSVTLYGAATPWQHIRQIGEDICVGEMILPSFMEISPSAIGAMIAGGVLEVDVVSKPKIGIIPTGNEIVPPCIDPKPGDILEFNSSIFSSMVRQWGAEAVVYPIVSDDFERIQEMVRKAVDACDMVILNAGSSAGREDYSANVIRSLGQVLYHGISIKPGKPAILGCVGAVPVLGVPGYPVSGIIVIEELLKPLIDAWLKVDAGQKQYAEATLTRAIVSGLKYQEFVRVRMGYVGDRLMAAPLSRGSGVVTSFMKADGILEIPQGLEGYEAGDIVNIRLLSSVEKLKNTLMVIGSHDPLLDELADLLHRADTTVYMNSAHVGSMGGIMAIRRGEAHMAGCHLLDTTDGSYNYSFMKKYFPNGGARLVGCVGRQQGLMVAKDNPLGITAFRDIAKTGVRYVNRQKGSGTRILADYLCCQEGLDTALIYGYDREEMTHTSVAAQIANGSADAGMGIYSAAKLYDLMFIPICVENYDLIISDAAWDTPMVQQLLQILKSDAFKEKLMQLGGYTVEQTGEIKRYL